MTSLEARAWPGKLASVGRAAANCELLILDDAGVVLGPERVGEVVGRSPNMMSGYLNREEATQEILWRAPDGKLYFRSGDVGRLDDDGFLYLHDRKKDTIVSGGFNIYASDLEAQLIQHEEVEEAAAIGVPSERWGETPVAFVALKERATVTEEALLEWVNGKLGKAQRLAALRVLDELPKNAIGKILKRELRETQVIEVP